MKSKFKLTINEGNLRQLVRESFYNSQILNENQDHFIKTDLDIAREVVTEINWKGAALGAMMGASVLGGMQSCSPINPAQQVTNRTTTQRNEWPDCSDRPWAFESYIGRKMEATYLNVEDKHMLKDLYLDIPTNVEEYQKAGFTYTAIFQECSWAIGFEKTEKRDNYFVDIYHTHGAPLFDKPNPDTGEFLDGEAYFELWYTNDESLSMNERAAFIKVYRSPGEKSTTTWTISLDSIKKNGRINITDKK